MRKIFINASEQLRPGWRLLIWLVIAVGIQVLIGIVVRLLHLGNEGAFLDPKRLILGDWVATFIPVIIATLVMMRIDNARSAITTSRSPGCWKRVSGSGHCGESRRCRC